MRVSSENTSSADSVRALGPATSKPTTSWKCAALEIKTLQPKLSPRTNELSAESGIPNRAPIACGSPVATGHRQQGTIAGLAVELRLSYLTQYANQDAGHSDPMRA